MTERLMRLAQDLQKQTLSI